VNPILSFMKRHSLIMFFCLAYALSWFGNLFELHSMFPMGPFLAALIMLALTSGKTGIFDFLRQIVQWRVGLRWYALVLLLPPTIIGVAMGLNLLLGAQLANTVQLPPFADLLPTFLFILIGIGLGEEPAWRGFALPRLLIGRTALAAALLLGLLHAIWHLPLFGLEYDMQNGLPWFLSVMAFAIVTTWLYNHTQGNLLLPILFHTAQNLTAGYLFNPTFSGADLIQLWWLMAALWCALAAAIVIATGSNLIRQPVIYPVTKRNIHAPQTMINQ